MDTELFTAQEQFDAIPSEVKSYIYSKEFIDSFENLCKAQQLTPDQISQLRGSLYNYIAQIETMESVAQYVASIAKTPQSNQAIMQWVQEILVHKVVALAEQAYIEEPGEEIVDNPVSSPSIPLGIQNSLTKPTTLTPVKRDLSMDRSTQALARPTGTIDPYREIPEK